MQEQISRRAVLGGLAATGALAAAGRSGAALTVAGAAEPPLEEFAYGQVAVTGSLQRAQVANAAAVMMGLSEDSLLRPFRAMAGMPAPGVSLGGWYEWKLDFDFHHDDAGFAPASTFGQWTSALSRMAAAPPAMPGAPSNDVIEQGALAQRVLRLHEQLLETIRPGYFEQTRFPAYSFDKLLCGLMDAHTLAGDKTAWETLTRVYEAALPSLPKKAIERERQYLMGRDPSWMWDESYTMPENLYLAYSAGAGERYRRMAREYLEDETFFRPLSQEENVLSDRHAYSYTNALCSAMQAYFVDGSEMHLRAAKNAFRMMEAQSFVTGGWGPDELFRKPGYGQVEASLTKTHNSFEVPCGSYAHLKLTRYLVRATRDGHYGDSMERVLYNCALGLPPILADGQAFYYADYNLMAKRVYSTHRWPCCSGTLPQLAADYGINTYLRSPGAIWVNLYQPSRLQWRDGGGSGVLEQTGDYPTGNRVTLRFAEMAQPARLALHLRLPEWAGGSARVRVNGEAVTPIVERGFARLERSWRAGDAVELELPMQLRLEAMPLDWAPMRIGPMYLDTVALLRGPEVLFALRDPWETGPLGIKTEALLNAQQTGPREWTAATPLGPRRMVPWSEIGKRSYTTYVKAL